MGSFAHGLFKLLFVTSKHNWFHALIYHSNHLAHERRWDRSNMLKVVCAQHSLKGASKGCIVHRRSAKEKHKLKKIDHEAYS